MKQPDKKLWLAFVLNLCFSLFEFIGGSMTGSVAIASDAIHDFSDAISIGIACVLEHKTIKTGHAKYSLMGAAITTGILLIGSCIMIVQALVRIINPAPIHYDGMLLFALAGVGINLAAALLTRQGHSTNQKAINLHMLEDVLGWLVVLFGAIIMRFTDFVLLDPLMSLGVSAFIGIHAGKHSLQIYRQVKNLHNFS